MDNISIWISAAALLCSISMVLMTRKRDGQTDIAKEIRTAESFKEINVKLDFQSKQLEEMSTTSRITAKEMQEMHDRHTQLESKVDRAFELIDAIRGGRP